MCGRYASSSRPEDLVEEFEVVENRVGTALEADFNVAPSKEVYAVLERPARTGADGGRQPQARQLRTVRWGLVPSWAKDPSIGNRMINARVETAGEKPAFRKAFRTRRCLLPADGYYEWYAPGDDAAPRGRAGKPLKQPYFIRPADGSVLAMAGLFEIWRDPTLPHDHPNPFRWTCTVLTTTATDELGHIHERMPMMVTADSRDAWLDPTFEDPERVRALLTPATPGTLEAYPVSRAVNDVRNNGAHLIDPLPVEEGGPSAGPGEQLNLIGDQDL